MNEKAAKFVELMGRHLEEEGVPRIAGRLMGALLLNREPSSLDDLTKQLQVSKGSVSSNARLLENWGIAEKVTVPGDRRDFYQISKNVDERVLLQQIERNRLMRERLQVGLAGVAEESVAVRERLESLIAFMERTLETQEELLAQTLEQSR